VVTTARGRNRLRIDSKERADSLLLTMSGRIRLDAGERRYRRRIANPMLYAGTVFRRLLAEQGVRIDQRELVRGTAPTTASRVAHTVSPPVAELVRSLGKYSNNFVAEVLFKTIGAEVVQTGAPATWVDAQRAVSSFLIDAIGLRAAGFRCENGSGLFDGNGFSPRQLTTLLRAGYRDFRYGPDLVAALALAGADGTLSTRMIEGPGERQVRAKTGTLAAASALSGYVAVVGSEPLAFSILINNLPQVGGAMRSARSLQDQVAEALVLYLRAR
jgi:serine-type D-Ala-D-Ala carboxypeptidase/endopeptidase (penicillin-binding protein 4)